MGMEIVVRKERFAAGGGKRKDPRSGKGGRGGEEDEDRES